MADIAKLKAALGKIKDRKSKQARAIRKQLRDAGAGLRQQKTVKKIAPKKAVVKSPKVDLSEGTAEEV